MPSQLVLLGRQNHIGRLFAHFLFDQRHGHTGKVLPEGLKTLEQCLVKHAEESRYTLDVQDMHHLIDHAAG